MSKTKISLVKKAKSCPFCGNYPETYTAEGGGTRYVKVYCNSTDCAALPAVIEHKTYRGSETPKQLLQQAVNKWNSRESK